ncbi:hypothetical protein [Chitinimonas sp.]|uniref:phage tail terminator protein n=1 Tax=Chitinimonas sp. TaxID=1934313 RepID=UPI0035AECE9E
MLIDAIKDQLKTRCPLLKHIGAAADFAAADKLARHQYPAAFVLPLGEQPQPSSMPPGTVQKLLVHFAVVIAISNVRDAAGAAALVDLNAVRPSVMQALYGWQPAGVAEPINFTGGQLQDLTNGVLWWQDSFSTVVFNRSTH